MKKLKLFAPFNAELFFSNIDLQFVNLKKCIQMALKVGLNIIY